MITARNKFTVTNRLSIKYLNYYSNVKYFNLKYIFDFFLLLVYSQ
ncbi:hypothetical protein A1OE_529 [Candidatus Endolissoclinum faulkneri L2]|uniref:Uncharacterized protein n=1 Tax=Candidatus Endolissoclinum faulkneri L2 TaxID=1193729 RepID=K7YMH3_9PROT|nr:hypothetical protein A1OE_529 [Candidatus Endolissoclinum faulkneri L2]